MSCKTVAVPVKVARSTGIDQQPAKAERLAHLPALNAEHWAGRINQHLCRSLSALIEAGRELLAAKTQLDHGEWQKLFEKGLLQIHLREAQRLMEIAGHPVLSKAKNCSFLPPSPQALCALAKASLPALQAAINAKEITSRTTIQEANRFRSLHPASSSSCQTPSAAKEVNMDRSLKRCSDVLWAELNKWPRDRLDLFLDEIQKTVRAMENARFPASNFPDGTKKDALPLHEGKTVKILPSMAEAIE